MEKYPFYFTEANLLPDDNSVNIEYNALWINGEKKFELGVDTPFLLKAFAWRS
jgi:hypothetical protein